jgi:hypothetical protein
MQIHHPEAKTALKQASQAMATLGAHPHSCDTLIEAPTNKSARPFCPFTLRSIAKTVHTQSLACPIHNHAIAFTTRLSQKWKKIEQEKKGSA